MNAKELADKLESVIKELGWKPNNFAEYYELSQKTIEDCFNDKKYPMTREELAKDQKLVDTLGAFRKVQEERTGSDYDEMEYIFHFTDHNIYLAISASYSSWDSPTFYTDVWHEVRPRQSTVTHYEAVL